MGRHDVDGFQRDRHGLRPVRSHEWLDLVFVNLSGDAPPFEDHVAPLMERWKPFVSAEDLAELRLGASYSTITMDVAANWKLAVENFCESYHLPWIHPRLNKRSRLEDHYHIFGDDLFVGQGSTVYDPDYLDGERFPSFETWPSDKRTCAEYVALFPNAWIGLHVDHLFTAILSPAAKRVTCGRGPQGSASPTSAPRASKPGTRCSPKTSTLSKACKSDDSHRPSGAGYSRP